tara:strand:+ start:773 stop:1480 length:708 start_codon:yes stop_codon:yes gene_type:complete
MKLNLYLIFTISSLLIILNSCDKEEENNPGDISFPGCTNLEALNYNPDATIDDGSCIILGCTDENAINYNPEATDDDNSCEYSINSMLNGNWNIILLNYETEVDLSFLESVIGFNLGTQQISGQAENAGILNLNSNEFTYESELNFDTEPFPILTFEAPSIPFNYTSLGTWFLENNETDLIFTDQNTGQQDFYEIISINDESAFLNGTVTISQDIMGFEIDLEMDVQMQLEKETI